VYLQGHNPLSTSKSDHTGVPSKLPMRMVALFPLNQRRRQRCRDPVGHVQQSIPREAFFMRLPHNPPFPDYFHGKARHLPSTLPPFRIPCPDPRVSRRPLSFSSFFFFLSRCDKSKAARHLYPRSLQLKLPCSSSRSPKRTPPFRLYPRLPLAKAVLAGRHSRFWCSERTLRDCFAPRPILFLPLRTIEEVLSSRPLSPCDPLRVLINFLKLPAGLPRHQPRFTRCAWLSPRESVSQALFTEGHPFFDSDSPT